jgi:hypothetical protein
MKGRTLRYCSNGGIALGDRDEPVSKRMSRRARTPHAQHRVGEDVEGDEQAVVALHHRVVRPARAASRPRAESTLRTARGKALGVRADGGRSNAGCRGARRPSASASATRRSSSTSTPVSPSTTVSSAPPRPEGDHRASARLRLDGHDAEVLLARQQHAAGRDTAPGSPRRTPPEELDVPGRPGSQRAPVRAVADDGQRHAGRRQASMARSTRL